MRTRLRTMAASAFLPTSSSLQLLRRIWQGSTKQLPIAGNGNGAYHRSPLRRALGTNPRLHAALLEPEAVDRLLELAEHAARHLSAQRARSPRGRHAGAGTGS